MNTINHDQDHLWYKDAIIYELRVPSFFDSNGDGAGDFRGLVKKLDYLLDLGVTALWLLPFYPSPTRDDGYDIANYIDVNPECGSIADFRDFLNEAHSRDLRVITEMVLNHTSDQHPWFQRARKSRPGSRYRDFYVWSDSPHRYLDARIIFKDFEASNWTWDPVAGAYYWHRFYAHQPDLNFDSEEVQRAIINAMDFWWRIGVDGMRLDAVPYLYEREGTNCENLPETHAFLRQLRTHVETNYPGRMLIAEANQWPEDAAAYFGNNDGDECHMAFHFPLMPRMFMSINMEDRFPVIDIMTQTPSIPENCQWAMFLRNHDELTLEMVTDEERDYMYRVYAHDSLARINLGIRRRLAPLLGNDRRQIELMNGLLFTMPGTPVIYYGDEIGMGDNFYLGDRNGVRTPMQWNSDRNAGFSRTNPQRLYLPVIIDPDYHFEAVNVEMQQNNIHSLLWWMKRLIALRKKNKALSRGSIEFLRPNTSKVLALVRSYQGEHVLAVANLSRFAQCAELDLAKFSGMRLVEMFGDTEFPVINNAPYLMTLGARDFYWFKLRPDQPSATGHSSAQTAAISVATIEIQNDWNEVFTGKDRVPLQDAIPGYLSTQRWFGERKAQNIKIVRITDRINIDNSSSSVIMIVRIEYTEGETENFALPLSFTSGHAALHIRQKYPYAIIANLLKSTADHGIIYDAIYDADFCQTLLDAIGRRRSFRGTHGSLQAVPTRVYAKIRGNPDDPLPARVLSTHQRKDPVIFGDQLAMKMFRKLNEGKNPDLEIGHVLTRASFAHIALVVGFFNYQTINEMEPATIGIIQNFITHQNNAYSQAEDEVARYYERRVAQGTTAESLDFPQTQTLELTELDPGLPVLNTIGGYLETARLIGIRTAELHVALASATENEFVPEPFSVLYQRALYQSIRNSAGQLFGRLHIEGAKLPDEVQSDVNTLFEIESSLMRNFRTIIKPKITAQRIRCHGDYHLRQLLYTGKDFVIVDFEGDPTRPISERRIKKSPLLDVAGVLQSFYEVAFNHIFVKSNGNLVHTIERPELTTWGTFWQAWVSSAFLRSYLKTIAPAKLLPTDIGEMKRLLWYYLMETAIKRLEGALAERQDQIKLLIYRFKQLSAGESLQ